MPKIIWSKPLEAAQPELLPSAQFPDTFFWHKTSFILKKGMFLNRAFHLWVSSRNLALLGSDRKSLPADSYLVQWAGESHSSS